MPSITRRTTKDWRPETGRKCMRASPQRHVMLTQSPCPIVSVILKEVYGGVQWNQEKNQRNSLTKAPSHNTARTLQRQPASNPTQRKREIRKRERFVQHSGFWELSLSHLNLNCGTNKVPVHWARHWTKSQQGECWTTKSLNFSHSLNTRFSQTIPEKC